MPLHEKFLKSVAFIVGERGEGGPKTRVPIGTGFFIGISRPLILGQRQFTSYLVTAAHVVQRERVTWVRLRRSDGSLEDTHVSGWEYHDRADVAIAVCDPPNEGQRFDFAVMPQQGFVTGDYEPMLGDRVYFSGLFSTMRALGERNVPLVRSGTLAAWSQPGVPMEISPIDRLEQTAHLIDCRSYSGFSGSPCVVQFPRKRPSGQSGGVGRPEEQTELIGLVSGHFDDVAKTGVAGETAEKGSVGVPVNTGVGVITPVESVLELLGREDVVEDRTRREREFRPGYQEAVPASEARGGDESRPEHVEELEHERRRTSEGEGGESGERAGEL